MKIGTVGIVIIKVNNMKQPKTLKGYISILKMMERVWIGDLKQGNISDKTKRAVVDIQADISNYIDTIN